MLSRRSAPVWAAAAISVCTHRAYQFWDGGWVKKNDQVASPRDPDGGYGPAAATYKLTRKTYSFPFVPLTAGGKLRPTSFPRMYLCTHST